MPTLTDMLYKHEMFERNLTSYKLLTKTCVKKIIVAVGYAALFYKSVGLYAFRKKRVFIREDHQFVIGVKILCNVFVNNTF